MKRRIHLQEDGTDFWVTVERHGDELTIQRDNAVYTVSVLDVERVDERGSQAAGSETPTSTPPSPAPRSTGLPPPNAQAGEHGIPAPMTGVIKEVIVSDGDTVEAGERIILMEAMKMDIEVNAPRAGTVSAVHVASNDNVREGQILMEVE